MAARQDTSPLRIPHKGARGEELEPFPYRASAYCTYAAQLQHSYGNYIDEAHRRKCPPEFPTYETQPPRELGSISRRPSHWCILTNRPGASRGEMPESYSICTASWNRQGQLVHSILRLLRISKPGCANSADFVTNLN
jgi:hypothetical protein